MATVNEKMTAIADSIRSKTGGTKKLNLDQMASAVGEVYEAGKKAEYDEFWDEYQENGNRSYYANAFGSLRWNDKTYKPKYHIRPNASYDNLFHESRVTDTKVDIDFSLITSPKTINRIFAYNTALVTIRKIIVNENIIFGSWFSSCKDLENITFEGVIGQNGLNLQWSEKLSRASFESIVRAYSTTIEGLSCTFSEQARAAAFTDEEWEALRAERPNVTFYFV